MAGRKLPSGVSIIQLKDRNKLRETIWAWVRNPARPTSTRHSKQPVPLSCCELRDKRCGQPQAPMGMPTHPHGPKIFRPIWVRLVFLRNPCLCSGIWKILWHLYTLKIPRPYAKYIFKFSCVNFFFFWRQLLSDSIKQCLWNFPDFSIIICSG